MITTVISFICVLGFLVFVHELGHFLAARKVGVTVTEFSIGFPPKIASKVIGATEYMISWIPLGGYVRLKGQDIDDEDPTEYDNYASKTIAQRFFILIAGPLANFITALIFMPLVFLIGYDVPSFFMEKPVIYDVTKDGVAHRAGITKGDLIVKVNNQTVSNWREVEEKVGKLGEKDQRDSRILSFDLKNSHLRIEGPGWKAVNKPVIGNVAPGSPADKAGLKSGDLIVSLADNKIENWSQLSPFIQESDGNSIRFTVLRAGETKVIEVIPQYNKERKYWNVGIGSSYVTVSENLIDSIIMGVNRVKFLTVATFEFLYRMITGSVGSESVGGPIMIAQMVGQAAKSGANDLVALIGYISLQLGIFNLLPIPALDGGHIFFLALEKIKGSALSKKFRINTQKAGFSILMFLILYISVQDGLRLFQ